MRAVTMTELELLNQFLLFLVLEVLLVFDSTVANSHCFVAILLVVEVFESVVPRPAVKEFLPQRMLARKPGTCLEMTNLTKNSRKNLKNSMCPWVSLLH